VEVFDLSAPLDERTPIFPGDPPYFAQRFLDREKDGVNELKLSIGTHTGTHVDVPLHHISGGKDVSEFPLGRFVGPALVARVDKGPGKEILPEDLAPKGVQPEDILIVSTGWEDRLYKDDYFTAFPVFSPDVAHFLAETRIKALATDTPSVDPLGSHGEFHRLVLARGIGIVEALVNLRSLRGERVFFCAVPLKIKSGDGSPVRAIAVKNMPAL